MKHWRANCACAAAIFLAACMVPPKDGKSAAALADGTPKKELTEVERARANLTELTARQKSLTQEMTNWQRLLFSLPRDSPSTREITRQLAIANKRTQEIALPVFEAEDTLNKAIKAEKTAREDAAFLAQAEAAAAKAAAATAAAAAEKVAAAAAAKTNSPTGANHPSTAPAFQSGSLKLSVFRLTSNQPRASILSGLWGLNPFSKPLSPATPGEPRFVMGEVQNTSTNAVANVTVVFSLFDAAGDSIGPVSDFVNQITPGAQWFFKALVPDDTAVRAEFKELKSGAPAALPALPGTNPTPAPSPTQPPSPAPPPTDSPVPPLIP